MKALNICRGAGRPLRPGKLSKMLGLQRLFGALDVRRDNGPDGALVAELAQTHAQNISLTAALPDRLPHHTRMVPITVESFRFRHKRQAGIVQDIRTKKAA